MKKQKGKTLLKQRKKQNGGITLIALVITVIVLLILTAVTIATLSGENGILNKAGQSKTETIHTQIYEAIQIEVQGYLIETASNRTGTLEEYLQQRGILYSNKVINLEKLLGNKTSIGNGDKDGLVDVYKLEEVIETGELASNTHIKVATADKNKIYKIVYYNTKGEIEISREILNNKANNTNNQVKVSIEKTPIEIEVNPNY